MLDNFIYIFGPQAAMLEKVKLEGVFQNPREISNFTDSNDHMSYDPETQDYPLSTSMLDLIKQSLKEL